MLRRRILTSGVPEYQLGWRDYSITDFQTEPEKLLRFAAPEVGSSQLSRGDTRIWNSLTILAEFDNGDT